MLYYIPVKIYEESNAIANHTQDLKALGSTALIVTGKSSAKKCGALSDIEAALNSADIKHFLFDQVEENPSTDTILAATDYAKDKNIDFVIGIGGGSPMDASKAIALMLKNPTKGLDFMYDKSAKTSALPVVAIPTTCGTGSEATGVSVLTRHDTQSKGSIPHKIFPTLALCDYKYLKKLPERVLKSSAIDALCHAAESLIHAKSTEYSEMFAMEALRCLGPSLKALIDNQVSDELLNNLLHASTLAGMAIAHTGTALPHALSYRLTYDDSISHGFACAYFLPDYVKISSFEYKNKLLNVLNLTSEQELSTIISALCDFSDIKKETVEKSLTEVKNNPAKLSTAPFDVSILFN